MKQVHEQWKMEKKIVVLEYTRLDFKKTVIHYHLKRKKKEKITNYHPQISASPQSCKIK